MRFRRMPPRYMRRLPPPVMTKEDWGCLVHVLIVFLWFFILVSCGVNRSILGSELSSFGWFWLFAPVWGTAILTLRHSLSKKIEEEKKKNQK